MSQIKQFPLPDLGEGLTEGEILKWLVQVGDMVTQNQPIVEVETAKAAVEIPAKWAGRVTEIHHPEGSTVEVGSPIISIDTDPGAEAAVEIPPAEGATEPGMIGGPAPGGRTAVLVGYGPRTGAAKRRPRKQEAATTTPARSGKVTVEEPPSPEISGKVLEKALVKPPVRKLARDLGVDLSTLDGTGPRGSITREDVQGATITLQAPAAPAAPAFGPDREQRIQVKGVRKLTAANTVASAFTAPHVTEFLAVDMTRTMRALGRLRELPEWREVRVSPLLLVALACLGAIRRHPMVNSTWSAETFEIVVKEYVNLGIAAATERGLIVPNIKDAGRLGLRQLADAMSDLVSTARTGRTTPAGMSGGTFTITNVGVFGVDTGTPILPPGEAAILAFGAVRDTPWVHRGKIKIRQVSTLALSFDHRIIDGELGSMYLRDVGAFLTDPEATLLSWS